MREKIYNIILFFSLFYPMISQAKQCGNALTIVPYLGIDEKAIVTIPFYNQDVILLKQRQKLIEHKPSLAYQCPSAIFELSGMLAAIARLNNPVSSYSTSLYLDNGELDFVTNINNLITTFIDVAYSNQPISTVGQFDNSKINLDRFFVTIGDFQRSPYYATVGRRYVPFGQYNSYTITGPLGQTLGKTEGNSILFGYQHPANSGPYAAMYIIKSIKKLFWDGNQKSIAGFTAGYSANEQAFNIDIGVDYTQSISISQGFQAIGVRQNLAGIDVHAKAELNQYLFLAEYTAAIGKFNQDALSYKNRGASPSAMYYELVYQAHSFNKDSSVAFGYGRSFQSTKLNIPIEMLNLSYNIALAKNVILGFQYQHNINYVLCANMIDKNIFFLRLLTFF